MKSSAAVLIIASLFILALGMIFNLPTTRAETLVGTTINSDSDDDTPSKVAVSPQSDNARSTSKADETPHFWQRDRRGRFENGGRDYCCPVAVSNSFVYLAQHGFPGLLTPGEGDQPQIDLINQLVLPGYFDTDPNTGTTPGSVLTGVQRYVENHGYHCARLEYEGWRRVGHDNADAVKDSCPQLDWIADGIRDPHGAVWLNVGWYAQDGAGEWKRTGGHWVTVVGYGNAPHILLIHNPALRRNNDQPDDPARDLIRLDPLSSGTLHTGGQSTENATGLYRVSGPGLPLDRGVDAAILDAAVVFVIRP